MTTHDIAKQLHQKAATLALRMSAPLMDALSHYPGFDQSPHVVGAAMDHFLKSAERIEQDANVAIAAWIDTEKRPEPLALLRARFKEYGPIFFEHVHLSLARVWIRRSSAPGRPILPEETLVYLANNMASLWQELLKFPSKGFTVASGNPDFFGLEIKSLEALKKGSTTEFKPVFDSTHDIAAYLMTGVHKEMLAALPRVPVFFQQSQVIADVAHAADVIMTFLSEDISSPELAAMTPEDRGNYLSMILPSAISAYMLAWESCAVQKSHALQVMGVDTSIPMPMSVEDRQRFFDSDRIFADFSKNFEDFINIVLNAQEKLDVELAAIDQQLEQFVIEQEAAYVALSKPESATPKKRRTKKVAAVTAIDEVAPVASSPATTSSDGDSSALDVQKPQPIEDHAAPVELPPAPASAIDQSESKIAPVNPVTTTAQERVVVVEGKSPAPVLTGDNPWTLIRQFIRPSVNELSILFRIRVPELGAWADRVPNQAPEHQELWSFLNSLAMAAKDAGISTVIEAEKAKPATSRLETTLPNGRTLRDVIEESLWSTSRKSPLNDGLIRDALAVWQALPPTTAINAPVVNHPAPSFIEDPQPQNLKPALGAVSQAKQPQPPAAGPAKASRTRQAVMSQEPAATMAAFASTGALPASVVTPVKQQAVTSSAKLRAVFDTMKPSAQQVAQSLGVVRDRVFNWLDGEEMPASFDAQMAAWHHAAGLLKERALSLGGSAQAKAYLLGVKEGGSWDSFARITTLDDVAAWAQSVFGDEPPKPTITPPSSANQEPAPSHSKVADAGRSTTTSRAADEHQAMSVAKVAGFEGSSPATQPPLSTVRLPAVDAGGPHRDGTPPVTDASGEPSKPSSPAPRRPRVVKPKGVKQGSSPEAESPGVRAGSDASAKTKPIRASPPVNPTSLAAAHAAEHGGQGDAVPDG